jgi:hypothetical protein
MGGVLPPRPRDAEAPAFAIRALRDPGTPDLPGTPLQRIQVVKLWEEDGRSHERIHDVAGSAEPRPLDPDTCAPPAVVAPDAAMGHDQLCRVWRDPDFSPGRHALYYARVLEQPSCRWQQFVCRNAGVRCEEPATVRSGYEACCDPDVPKTIQERAWTSPIWFDPSETGTGDGNTP